MVSTWMHPLIFTILKVDKLIGRIGHFSYGIWMLPLICTTLKEDRLIVSLGLFSYRKDIISIDKETANEQ